MEGGRAWAKAEHEPMQSMGQGGGASTEAAHMGRGEAWAKRWGEGGGAWAKVEHGLRGGGLVSGGVKILKNIV